MRPPHSNLIMQTVDSEAVWQIGHDPKERVLYVRFSSGDIYGYEDVSEELFSRFKAAPSQGRFFQTEIDGAYRYEKL
jgi:hypothetical protein